MLGLLYLKKTELEGILNGFLFLWFFEFKYRRLALLALSVLLYGVDRYFERFFLDGLELFIEFFILLALG